MTTQQLFYRVVINKPGSTWAPGQTLTANEIIFSTSGSSNNLLLEPPRGDGQTIDPLTGKWTVGVYDVQVIDAHISGDPTGSNDVRAFTQYLADVTARHQLQSRPAFVQYSNDTVTWNTLVGGFVNAIRAVNAMVYNITIGETRRIENTFKPFKNFTTASFSGSGGVLVATGSAFQSRTCFIGGPISGGFAGRSDVGPWEVHVSSILSTNGYGVVMTIDKATMPSSEHAGFFAVRGLAIQEMQRLNAIVSPFYQRDSTTGTGGTFRNCIAKLTRKTNGGTFMTQFKSTAPLGLIATTFNRTGLLSPDGRLVVAWDTGSLGAVPAVNEKFLLYGFYSGPVSEEWPLYVEGHPVDIVSKQYNEVGILYDTTSAASTRASIPDVQLALRITDPDQTLSDFHDNTCFGPFGFGVRSNASGSREFMTTRVKVDTLPSETITLNDLNDGEAGTIWQVSEKDIVNSVTVTQENFVDWAPELHVNRTNDQLVVFHDVATIVREDPLFYGTREIKYTLPGQIFQVDNTFWGILFRLVTGHPFFQPMTIERFNDFAQGISYEIFDRYLRGLINTDLLLVRNISASIGDEVILTLPHLPNALIGQTPTSQKGNQSRIMQIVQRTETPTGPQLHLVDSGDTAQSPLTPSFTLATGSDGRYFFDITVTNSGSFIFGGSNIRSEVGYGLLQPSGGLQTVILSSSLGPVIHYHQTSGGTIAWVRLRAEASASLRPSAWTAWQSLQMASLSAPSNLTSSVSTSGFAILSWSLGETDVPVEMFLWPGTQPFESASFEGRLPAGSTQGRVALSGSLTPYSWSVRHAEDPPFAGFSKMVSASFIGCPTVTMSVPLNARAFVGGQLTSLGKDYATMQGKQVAETGVYGLNVLAPQFPSYIEFSEATESVVGSGVFSGYDSVFVETSNQIGTTTYASEAPNDGKARAMRARTIRVGALDSDWTTPQVVVPWHGVVLDPNILHNAYVASADDAEGGVIPSTTTFNDGLNHKQFVRGKETGVARHRDNINFDFAFANIPKVTIQGGILFQPAPLWGSGSQIDTFQSGALFPDSASAQVEDFAALNLTTTGFTVQARLRQHGSSATGTITDNFIPMKILSGSHEISSSLNNISTTPISASQAPAANGQYHVTGSVTMSEHCYSTFGGGTTLLATVDTDTGAGFVQKASQVIQMTDTVVGSHTSSFALSMNWTDTLDNNDQIRIRVDRFYVQGFIDASSFVLSASSLFYTAGADLYASKTPASTDLITWVAEGYLSS